MATPVPGAGEMVVRTEVPPLERTVELPIVAYDPVGNPIRNVAPMDGFSAGADSLARLGAGDPALGGGVYGSPLGSFRVGTAAAVPVDLPLLPTTERQNFFGTVEGNEANFSLARLPEGQTSASWGHTAVPVSVVAIEGNSPNASPGSRNFMVSVRFRLFGEGYADVRMNGEQAQAMGINLNGIPRDGNPLSLLWQQRSLYTLEVTDRSASVAPESPLPTDPMAAPPVNDVNASGADPIPQALLFSTNAATGAQYCIMDDGVASLVAPYGVANPARVLTSSIIPGAQTWVLEGARWNGQSWEGGHWDMVPPGSNYNLSPQQVFAVRNPLGETHAYQLSADGNSRIPREFH